MNKVEKIKDRWFLVTSYGNERIHVVHDEPNEDSQTFVVAEEGYGNFARLHMLNDFSEDEALQTIDTYVCEKEDGESGHIISVWEVEL